MRLLTIWRVIAAVLLLGGAFVAPAFDTSSSHVVARDENKDESRGKEKGNNQGKGNEKEKDRDKDKNHKSEKNEGRGATIARGEEYVVDVACDYDDVADTTTCTFTGIAPEGAKDVSHVDLPQEAVCADVVDGDYEYVDPDPNTGVTGFKPKGSEGTFTLVLTGNVTPAGSTTYWFKTGDGVFPATGPGLDCSVATQVQLETSPAPTSPIATATPSPTTGELVVLTYQCSDVPEDRTEYDWFGLCDPVSGVHGLKLAPVSEFAVEPHLVDTDASGDITFDSLEPGLYSLELAEGIWCKAFSDNVDPEGNVIIEAGQRTTVYGFVCEGKPDA